MGKEQSEFSIIRKAVDHVLNRKFLRDRLGLDIEKVRLFKLPAGKVHPYKPSEFFLNGHADITEIEMTDKKSRRVEADLEKNGIDDLPKA